MEENQYSLINDLAPTYINAATGKGSTKDLIFTSPTLFNLFIKHSFEIHDCLGSDHLPITAIFRISKKSIPKQEKKQEYYYTTKQTGKLQDSRFKMTCHLTQSITDQHVKK